MKSKQLIKIITENGWSQTSKKGSHHTFKHPNNKHIITIPHPKKDLTIGLLKSIFKIAGIEYTSQLTK